MSNSLFTTAVQYARQVGPRRAALLNKLDIYTIYDLLYHFPRRYEDRQEIKSVHQLAHNEVATVEGKVINSSEIRPRKGLIVTKLAMDDGLSLFYAVWFNQPHIRKNHPKGTRLYITGKVQKNFGPAQINVQDYEVKSEKLETVHAGRIVPVYALTGNISQRVIRAIIKGALDKWGGTVSEILPRRIIDKYHLPTIREALQQVHFPDSLDLARRARLRFIFEELFIFQTILALQKKKVTAKLKEHSYSSNTRLTEKLFSNLPFELTEAQKRTWVEIEQNLYDQFPMNRLLQGDVGSGKTIVCLLALLKAVDSGHQGAFMAPTGILAEQHYSSLKQYLHPLGISTALLTGSLTRKEKDGLYLQVKNGDIQLVVGTHALIQEGVEFQSLATVVIDEQHRFGVKQRAALQEKGYQPDVLVVTATPIPRTLALTLYGDLDVSVIDELPPGRKDVKTYQVNHSALHRVYDFMRKQVGKGFQVYVICPLVEESEELEDLRAVTELGEELAQRFSGFRVAILHGRMKSLEKEEIVNGFRSGQIDILVSTTVVEVGVDVPNATLMVILDANRFGLAQLHQLRGRVGRGADQSYCILVANPKTREARTRLKALIETTDGFKLAEQDLELRGPGELSGIRQAGLPNFKIANIIRDKKALDAARHEAFHLVKEDPLLQFKQHQNLKKYVREFIARQGKFINIS